jgi:hypothetical protein
MGLPPPFDPAAPADHTPASVAILLSTYNGAAFLPAQLDSIVAQEGVVWRVYWRDDGSEDGSVAVMERFEAAAGANRCVRIDTRGRMGVTASYMTLLRHVVAEGATTVAFSDQDDVWLPHKLERGLDALAASPREIPALYCARQVLVDAQLQRIGLSMMAPRQAAFPSALIQNVATGCTIMLNSRAARLVAASKPAPATLHDWWCYLVVTGAGGRLLQDPEPVILYRQHAGNLVGAPASMLRRAIGALRRGPGVFMGVMRQHVAALAAQPHLLTSKAHQEVTTLDRALRGGWRMRLAALRLAGLRRQTWAETLVFRCWFLMG